MSNIITYRPLCSVHVWHAYYLHPAEGEEQDWIDPENRPNALHANVLEQLASRALESGTYTIADDLSFAPTPQTAAFMQKMKMVIKPQKTGFAILVRVQQEGSEGYRPFMPFDTGFKLAFVIRARKPAFFNYTAIDFSANRQSIFYFSNLAGNRDGTNSLFLNASPQGLEPAQNYVSANDRLLTYNRKLVVDTNLSRVKLAFSNPLMQFETIYQKPEAGAETGLFSPSLIHLPSGRYGLKAYTETEGEIPELQRTLFWNPGDLPPDVLGVIELFHLSGAGLEEYAFLGADNLLQSPIYTLWWQNRSTYWRYIFNKGQPAPSTDNPDCQVRAEGDKNLISKEPQPLLSRYRKISYYAENDPENGEIRLPNPDSSHIYPEETGLYSEIHMGDIELDKVN
ncbi:MAG: hypothetical protein H6559_04110 [Lewinellaceae bacterium]|nr:hypothetical protein [Lewinellaceae bacterium]